MQDVVVIGGQGWADSGTQADIPPGDVRAYDMRTGALRRTFHVVPRPGEAGIETWERESWKDTGSAKAWSLTSADQELGYVYVPLSSAANEWYGGQRPGANLDSDSLVCLDARTGERKGHFQRCTTTSGTTTTRRHRCSPTSPSTVGASRPSSR